MPEFSDIPTLKELGYPDLVVTIGLDLRHRPDFREILPNKVRTRRRCREDKGKWQIEHARSYSRKSLSRPY
jgi:hypothetical protein